MIDGVQIVVEAEQPDSHVSPKSAMFSPLPFLTL